MDENIKTKLSKILSGLNKGKMSNLSELLNSEDGKGLFHHFRKVKNGRLFKNL